MLVLGDNLAQSANDFLRGGSESHDTLVFGRDGKVVEGKAGQVTSISAFLGQALCKGSKNIILSTADHGDTVLLVPNIAQLVNSLSGGGTLLSLGVEHGVDEVGDIIEGWWLGRSSLGRLMLTKKTR